MRRILAFEWLTTDGYFAASDGSLSWVVPDDEQARAAADGMPAADTVLFGRRTYEVFEGFWRKVPRDSPTAPDPHRPGQQSREHRAIAAWMHEATKLVFSRTLPDVTWHNARLIRELDMEELVAMKQRPGKDMLIFGSGSIVSQLTRHALVDEYQFVVCPVFLGAGLRLLEGLSKRVRLELRDVRKYPSGDVSLRYAPQRPA
ncbi:MAG TPA: dihydrofolate reductase family protein [Methylomirabilota bacterium]|nr:dihydrofolate reductase family protein [Methylomirabilota bacterium]